MLEDFSTNEMTNVWILIIPIRLFMKALQWLLHWLHIFFFQISKPKSTFFAIWGEKSYPDIICTFFWENSQSEIEARGVSWSLYYIYFTSFRVLHFVFQGIFLHYMLLFFNFWVKIRPMFVKIWFRINLNWHYLAKSAKKKSCYLRLYRTMLCVVPLLNAYYMAVPLN